MRSAVIGAYFANDEGKRIRFVELSTKITHTDRLALDGAQLIALAAATSATGRLSDFDAQARALFPEWDFDSIGDATGPTGYVLYSVNVTLQFWKEFGDDPKRAIEEAIRRGGDTDTVGAMLGGILGASPGCSWHEPWKRTFGFPTVSSIENLPSNEGALYFRLLLTNLVALPAILLFGFRRLLPPY